MLLNDDQKIIVVNILEKIGLTSVKNLITNNYFENDLTTSYRNTLKVKLKRSNWVPLIKGTPETANAWYRGMSYQEVESFINSGSSDLGGIWDDHAFGGIAPCFDYAKSYVYSKIGVVIELKAAYNIPLAMALKEKILMKNPENEMSGLKSESETLSMGLGAKGTFSKTITTGVLNFHKGGLSIDEQKTARDVLNDWLKTGMVHSDVCYIAIESTFSTEEIAKNAERIMTNNDISSISEENKKACLKPSNLV